MDTVKEIEQKLSNHRERLFANYPIKSLAIFGSYAREEQKKQSDLDIVVEFSGKIGVRFIDLADDLEEITGLKVDLVSKKGIKEKYLKSIDSDLIYV